MTSILINVKKEKYDFLMELLQSFDFVQIQQKDDGDTEEEILANIKQGFIEMELVKRGKMKAKPIKDLLDEL